MKRYIFPFLAFLFVPISSCTTDDGLETHTSIVDTKDRVLYADETIAFPSPIKGEWTTSNKFVAYVSNGKLKAMTVGKAVMSDGAGNRINVRVNPRYFLYNDPVLDFGKDVSYVYSMYLNNGFNASIHEKNGKEYVSAGKETGVWHEAYFENGKLSEVYVRIGYNTTTTDNLLKFLNERYVYINRNSGFECFMGNTQKYGVFLKVNADSFYSIYKYEIVYKKMSF